MTVIQSQVTKTFENDDYDETLVKANETLTSVSIGGTGKGCDAHPVLYISEELAKKALLASLDDELVPGQSWCWDRKPVIEQFQMTEAQTKNMTHRVVANRYAGHCSILRVEKC